MIRMLFVSREVIEILFFGLKNKGAVGMTMPVTEKYDLKSNCTEKLMVTNKDPFSNLRELEGKTFKDPEESKRLQLEAIMKDRDEWDRGIKYANKILLS